MTANIQIIVDERTDVLKVPNAALRFRPTEEEKPGAARSAPAADPIMPEERLKQLSAILRLTEAQRNQVSVVLSDARERLSAMKQQDASPEEQRRETLAQRERTRIAIGALLSPEQREKFIRWSSGDAISIARGRVYRSAKKANRSRSTSHSGSTTGPSPKC